MLIVGFVLLLSPCGHDYCDALPVSEKIYATQAACEQVRNAIHQRRPYAVLFCGDVYRTEN